MNKSINYLLLQTCIITSVTCHAGTPQLNLNCESVSGNATISGFPRGEGNDLKIKIDNATLRYVDICSNAECSKQEKKGKLYVVEALNKKVFTIYFTEKKEGYEIFTGYFYALPESVKYTKTKNGYRAEYQALYDGADPRSDTSPKAFLKEPVQFTCKQDEEL